MLEKIKGLLAVKEDINSIQSDVGMLKKEVRELCEAIKKMQTDLFELNKTHKDFSNHFKGNVEIIEKTSKDFGDELFDFKILKGQLSERILKKFEEELYNEIKKNLEVLREDSSKYNKVRDEIKIVCERMVSAASEANKLIDISKNIKKEDFELRLFAKQLIEMDKEKIELMRKIDNLERLISSERRRRT